MTPALYEHIRSKSKLSVSTNTHFNLYFPESSQIKIYKNLLFTFSKLKHPCGEKTTKLFCFHGACSLETTINPPTNSLDKCCPKSETSGFLRIYQFPTVKDQIFFMFFKQNNLSQRMNAELGTEIHIKRCP